MKKFSWKVWAAAGAALLLIGGGAWWSQGRTAEPSYRTGKIERGALQAVVSASGTVNPVKQVAVSTQVSGQIKELYADFNAEVKAGQLIAQIDPQSFEYRVNQAQADVEAADAAVLTAQANGMAARAGVSRAQVDLNEAKRDHERKTMLVEKEFITKSEAEKAQALVNSMTEGLKAAEAQLAIADAQLKSARASVAQRKAALAQARVDLARTRITSPVNGIVIKRSVERGQTVAASLQAPELFVIAQNLQDMQVEASIDESDVGRLRTGQVASFTVDAFPGQTFEGEIRQVRKAAQNVSNVVTYVAVIGFANAGGRLLPGMTANVRIVAESRENVLKVPNAALRVRLPGVEPQNAPGRQMPPAAAHAANAGNATNAAATVSAASTANTATAKGGGGWSMPAAQAQPVAGARSRASVESPAPGTAQRAGQPGRLYLLGEGGKPVAYAVRLGISDGGSTELIVPPEAPEAAVLREGAVVITGVASAKAGSSRSGGGPRGF